jgi:hypothetical protein
MELVKRETCEQYVVRRLSEGWRIVKQEGFNVILQSPEGILRPVDLRNDVLTLRPSGAGAETNLHKTGAATNWQCVDEETPDEATTTVYSPEEASSSYIRDLYNLPASGGSGTINKITVYARGYYPHYTLDLGMKTVVKSGGTIDESVVHKIDSTWTTFSDEWALNPDDSEAWEWADIDALQIGVALYDRMDGWYEHCTQVYVEVDYEPPAGGSRGYIIG